MPNDLESKLATLIARCWMDEEFRNRFVAEPKSVIAEVLLDLSPDAELVVLQDTKKKRHIVLPEPPIDGFSMSDISSAARAILSTSMRLNIDLDGPPRTETQSRGSLYCFGEEPESPYCRPDQALPPYCHEDGPEHLYCLPDEPRTIYCREDEPEPLYCLPDEPRTIYCREDDSLGSSRERSSVRSRPGASEKPPKPRKNRAPKEET